MQAAVRATEDAAPLTPCSEIREERGNQEEVGARNHTKQRRKKKNPPLETQESLTLSEKRITRKTLD